MTTLPPMLPHLFRTLLLWLTLLAFPGLAAAAAQPCALHGRAAPMSMPTHLPHLRMADVNAHQAAAPPAACHDGGGSHDHRPDAHDHGRCGACAACCAGVAPAPALAPGPGGPGPAYVAVPFRPGHLPSVDPFPLERPPRPAFA